MTLQPKIATRAEAALYLRCSERQVDRLTRAGKLKSFKIGAGIRFMVADLDALLGAA